MPLSRYFIDNSPVFSIPSALSAVRDQAAKPYGICMEPWAALLPQKLQFPENVIQADKRRHNIADVAHHAGLRVGSGYCGQGGYERLRCGLRLPCADDSLRETPTRVQRSSMLYLGCGNPPKLQYSAALGVGHRALPLQTAADCAIM